VVKLGAKKSNVIQFEIEGVPCHNTVHLCHRQATQIVDTNAHEHTMGWPLATAGRSIHGQPKAAVVAIQRVFVFLGLTPTTRRNRKIASATVHLRSQNRLQRTTQSRHAFWVGGDRGGKFAFSQTRDPNL